MCMWARRGAVWLHASVLLEMGLAGESRPTACDVGPELWTVGPAEVVALLGWPLGPDVGPDIVRPCRMGLEPDKRK